MTINQKIDGVPRELLDALEKARAVLRSIIRDRAAGAHYASAQAACHQINATLDELRALLDAKPEENIPCPQCGGSLSTWGCTCTPRWPSYKADSRKKAAQLRSESVAWAYCPECGSEETHHEEGEHKQCADCHQEWFSDIDYTDVVRGHLKKLKVDQPAPVVVVLPERMSLEMAEHHTAPVEIHNGVVTGWNACLDEVTRLNTKE